jgi:hypothetical protein
MTGNSPPFKDSHGRLLYGMQYSDMEFICVPIPEIRFTLSTIIRPTNPQFSTVGYDLVLFENSYTRISILTHPGITEKNFIKKSNHDLITKFMVSNSKR